MIAAAFGAAQDFETRAVGTVAAGVGGSVDADDGLAESAGQMQRAGVSGNGQTDTAGEGDELIKGAGVCRGGTVGLQDDCIGQRLFAGSGIDNDAQAAPGERLRNLRVALDWPALCSPAGAGVNEDGCLGSVFGQDRVRPGSAAGSTGSMGWTWVRSSPATAAASSMS